MASARNRLKKRKPKADPVEKLALSIIPHQQFRTGNFAIRDIANHSEADQRAMVRSGSTKTIRRKTRIEMLRDAGVINNDQALACEWYAAAYQLGFQTIGCTANYAGAGGGGFGSSDLLARYKAQAEARENYHFARIAIPAHLVSSLDAVVLETGRPPQMMRKAEKLRFSLAAYLLHGQISHLLAVAA
jgi:hypothetical protein